MPQCNAIASNSHNVLQGWSIFYTLTSLIFLRSAWQGFNFTVIILLAFECCHVTKELFQARQEGIFFSIVYLNIDSCSLFIILLRIKWVLLGKHIINFYFAFGQREQTVPSSLKILFICNITFRKKKKICSFKQTVFLTKRKIKWQLLLRVCPDKLKQRRIDFPHVLCPQVLLHEHVWFNLTVLSQGEKQKPCQRSGLAVALPLSRDDFLVNQQSHEWNYPTPAQKVGRQKERQGAAPTASYTGNILWTILTI